MKEFLIKCAPQLTEFAFAETLNQTFEIQLLQSFIDNPQSVNDWVHYVIAHPQLDIRVIHSPLHQGADIDWDDLLNEQTLEIVRNTCVLGERLANHYGKPMPIVFHFGGDVEKIKQTPLLKENYLRIIQGLLHDFPNVLFYLENVTIVGIDKKNGRRTYRDADVETVPQFVRWLRESLNEPKRFKTVLDTCHALMVIRLLNVLDLPVTLEDFFQAHEGLCGLIHLANCRHYGLGPDHGTPFEETDQDLLVQLLDLYDRHQFNCPLTLEINEPDYLKYENYQKTVSTLKKLGYEI